VLWAGEYVRLFLVARLLVRFHWLASTMCDLSVLLMTTSNEYTLKRKALHNISSKSNVLLLSLVDVDRSFEFSVSSCLSSASKLRPRLYV
jgi:hypothetical protein